MHKALHKVQEPLALERILAHTQVQALVQHKALGMEQDKVQDNTLVDT